MVWACTEKIRQIHRQESGGDGGAGEKKERSQDRSRGGWITPRTTCRRELSGEVLVPSARPI